VRAGEGFAYKVQERKKDSSNVSVIRLYSPKRRRKRRARITGSVGGNKEGVETAQMVLRGGEHIGFARTEIQKVLKGRNCGGEWRGAILLQGFEENSTDCARFRQVHFPGDGKISNEREKTVAGDLAVQGWNT